MDNLLNKKTKRSPKFRLQAKNFFLTYPKCDVPKDEAFESLSHKVDLQYALIAQEQHMDGTPHLHALISSKIKLNIKNPNFFDLGAFHGNYQTVKNSDDVRAYIKKADPEPLEIGVYESNKQSELQKRAAMNKLLLEGNLPQLVDEGAISLYHYAKIKQGREQYSMDKIKLPAISEERVCYWIYGEPGIGKTYWVRSRFPNAYPKSQNKWWDGYDGQDVVILDDFDCAVLGHNLKIWADKYSFTAEIKGGSVKPVYTKFIVTSNYFPEEIFKMDPVLAKAVARRFIFCTIDSNYSLIKWGTDSIVNI